MQRETSLIIDLSFSSMNESINCKMEDFKISHLNTESEPNNYRVVTSEQDKLVAFLSENKIPYSIEGIFVHFHLNCRLFLSPNHHIELRAN